QRIAPLDLQEYAKALSDWLWYPTNSLSRLTAAASFHLPGGRCDSRSRLSIHRFPREKIIGRTVIAGERPDLRETIERPRQRNGFRGQLFARQVRTLRLLDSKRKNEIRLFHCLPV